MYASIAPWVSVPYVILPFIKRSGAGTKQYGEPITSKCYPVGDVKLVTNDEGAEVTSNTQLYVPGTEAIKATDAVIFEGTERSIVRISTFYRNGVPDIKVVYL